MYGITATVPVQVLEPTCLNCEIEKKTFLTAIYYKREKINIVRIVEDNKTFLSGSSIK